MPSTEWVQLNSIISKVDNMQCLFFIKLTQAICGKHSFLWCWQLLGWCYPGNLRTCPFNLLPIHPTGRWSIPKRHITRLNNGWRPQMYNYRYWHAITFTPDFQKPVLGTVLIFNATVIPDSYFLLTTELIAGTQNSCTIKKLSFEMKGSL